MEMGKCVWGAVQLGLSHSLVEVNPGAPPMTALKAPQELLLRSETGACVPHRYSLSSLQNLQKVSYYGKHCGLIKMLSRLLQKIMIVPLLPPTAEI